MIKKRIIPKLLLELSNKTGMMMTGCSIGFEEFRIVGGPESQAQIFESTVSDELMVLVRRGSESSFDSRLNALKLINEKVLMPVSFGGAISDLDQVRALFDVGIEKVIFGTAFQLNPKIIEKTAEIYGSQAVVASLDFKERFLDKDINASPGVIHIKELPTQIAIATDSGAGEICLNDVSRDGSMSGTNVAQLALCRSLTNLPLIQSSGVGKTSHFVEAFNNGADAVAVGTYFAFVDQNFMQIRSHIRNSGIDIRP
jgi:cyclase